MDKSYSNFNEIFNSTGDPAVNRYMDKILEDIKSKLSASFPIQIYGGTTAMEWYRKRELKQLENATIVINDEVTFTQKEKTYTTRNSNGEKETFAFTKDALPMLLGFNVYIYAKTIEQRNAIKEALISTYRNLIPVRAMLPNGNTFNVGIVFHTDSEGHYQRLKKGLGLNVGGLRVSPNGGFMQTPVQTEEQVNQYGFYEETLYFKRCLAIYFLDDVNDVKIKNNHKLQIDFLRLAEFYGQITVKLDEISKSLSVYKYLVEEPLTLYYKLNFPSLRELKDCYINRRPLDREKFNSLFANILEMYPNLYEKTINGWTFEQVKADILHYVSLFDQRFVDTFTAVGVPREFKRIVALPYEFSCLRSYANSMSKDYNITIQDAVEYEEECKIANKEWQNEERSSVSYQQSQNYDNSSSEGHGFLSGLYRSATSNRNSRDNDTTPKRSSGKQSLWGTAMCPWGKKGADGWTIRCNIGCPLWTQCGGK